MISLRPNPQNRVMNFSSHLLSLAVLTLALASTRSAHARSLSLCPQPIEVRPSGEPLVRFFRVFEPSSIEIEIEGARSQLLEEPNLITVLVNGAPVAEHRIDRQRFTIEARGELSAPGYHRVSIVIEGDEDCETDDRWLRVEQIRVRTDEPSRLSVRDEAESWLTRSVQIRSSMPVDDEGMVLRAHLEAELLQRVLSPAALPGEEREPRNLELALDDEMPETELAVARSTEEGLQVVAANPENLWLAIRHWRRNGGFELCIDTSCALPMGVETLEAETPHPETTPLPTLFSLGMREGLSATPGSHTLSFAWPRPVYLALDAGASLGFDVALASGAEADIRVRVNGMELESFALHGGEDGRLETSLPEEIRGAGALAVEVEVHCTMQERQTCNEPDLACATLRSSSGFFGPYTRLEYPGSVADSIKPGDRFAVHMSPGLMPSDLAPLASLVRAQGTEWEPAGADCTDCVRVRPASGFEGERLRVHGNPERIVAPELGLPMLPASRSTVLLAAENHLTMLIGREARAEFFDSKSLIGRVIVHDGAGWHMLEVPEAVIAERVEIEAPETEHTVASEEDRIRTIINISSLAFLVFGLIAYFRIVRGRT